MMEGTVLIADDDKSIRTVLTQALSRAGCRVKVTGCLKQLKVWVEAGLGDLVITDVMMPDGNGLETIESLHALRPDLPVIVISAQNSITTAVGAKKADAFDYLPKPFDLHQLLDRCAAGLARQTAQKKLPPPDISAASSDWPLTGRGPTMQALFRQAAQIINSNLPVVISGEVGSGRSSFAEALHDLSTHKSGGMFCLTAADTSASDKAAAATSGTLIIEDPAAFPPAEQAKLTALIGQWQKTATGPRLVAVTGPDPQADIETGLLRADLFYRLAGITFALPPLRERPEDILEIAGLMLRHAGFAGELDADAAGLLLEHDFPGNLRELEQLARRLALTATGPAITRNLMMQHLPPRKDDNGRMPPSLAEMAGQSIRRYLDMHAPELPPTGLHQRILQEVERPLLALALEATGGNQLRCAELLGINRNTLRKKMIELDIDISRRRGS